MKKRFLNLIREKKLFNKGDGIVLGVSGGADSMSMLHLFNSIKEEYNIHIHVVHLNHMFRGKDADDDEEYVKSICKEWGVDCFSFRRDVTAIANREKICFEDAGRKERYGLFEEVREKTASQKIAVAQNRNDQVETVLMHFFRGSGLDGLTGIEFIRNNIIIRPVMIFSRVEIEDYCKKNSIITRVDKTNFQTDYNRNRIRIELLPYIQDNINPKVMDSIFKTSELLTIDRNFINKVADIEYKNITKIENEEIFLDVLKFSELDDAIKSRIIRKIISKIKGDLKEVTQIHVLEILKLLDKNKTGTKKILFNKIFFCISYGTLRVYMKKNIENEILSKNIKEKKLKIIEMSIEEFNNINLNEHQIAIDKDKVFGKIEVRNRKSGDKFYPLGLMGSKKVKDFFIDKKIPKELRNSISIVCDEKNIIWIIGYRRDRRFEITNSTSKVLILQYYEL